MAAPPFQVTDEVLRLVSGVERLVGHFEGLRAPRPQPLLRKANRIRTIQATAAIEGNTLSLEQVTAVLDGRRVAGTPREVLEVQNVVHAYEAAPGFRAWSLRDLLAAHGLLMAGLTAEAGRWRSGNVGVVQGTRVTHVAPPPLRVPALMAALFRWGRTAPTSQLLKACVAHYEILFIHPFGDGNGRVARLWQQVALLEVSPVFAFVPVESLIRDRQGTYYRTLARADRAGDSTVFLEFSLAALRDGLAELLREVRPERAYLRSRLELARATFGRQWFSRKGYLELHKTLSTATGSRDLAQGVAQKLLRSRGARRLTEYTFAGAP